LMPDYDFDEFARRQEEFEKEYQSRKEGENASEDDMGW